MLLWIRFSSVYSKSLLRSILWVIMEENKENELQETEVVPVDEGKETIHFPWFIAIIMGVLMVAIIALVIIIKVIEG